MREPHPGIALNEYYVGYGYRLSARPQTRLRGHRVEAAHGSLYRSGRSKHWLKIKNSATPAVKREGEEDWGR
ncbi:MAG TPA: hypothetical protein VGJ20_01530 [Xanthobacteraceae bacterium]